MERVDENFPSIIKPEIQIALKEFLLLHKRYPIISVTWPSWVWKTTITEIIANELWAKIFTEQPEYNNFLKVIKETKWMVSDLMTWYWNQTFFLSTDVNEIIKATLLSKTTPIVFDFALSQTFIYSDMNLHWEYLKSFKEAYSFYFDSIVHPDIIIEVKSEDSVILDRLASRWKYIDGLIIKLVEKNTSYFKNWIVWDMYWWWDTRILTFDNSEKFPNTSLLVEKVIWFMKENSIN